MRRLPPWYIRVIIVVRLLELMLQSTQSSSISSRRPSPNHQSLITIHEVEDARLRALNIDSSQHARPVITTSGALVVRDEVPRVASKAAALCRLPMRGRSSEQADDDTAFS